MPRINITSNRKNYTIIQGSKPPVTKPAPTVCVTTKEGVVNQVKCTTAAGSCVEWQGEKVVLRTESDDKRPTVITITRQQLEALMGKVNAVNKTDTTSHGSKADTTTQTDHTRPTVPTTQPGFVTVIRSGQGSETPTQVIQVSGLPSKGVKRPLLCDTTSVSKRQCTETRVSDVRVNNDRQDAEVAQITSTSQCALTLQEPPTALTQQPLSTELPVVQDMVQIVSASQATSSPGSTMSTPTLSVCQDTQPGPLLEYPSLDTPYTAMLPSPITGNHVMEASPIISLHEPRGVAPSVTTPSMGATIIPPSTATAAAHWTPTPTGIIRNTRAIQPTSRNIINLLPFFSGSPGSEVRVMTPGIRQVKVINPAMGQVVAPSLGQVTLIPPAAMRKPVPDSSIDVSVRPQMKTPRSEHVVLATPITPQSQVLNPTLLTSSMKTPVGGNLVITPGSYFRSTPQVAAPISQIPVNGSSAFHVFSENTHQGEAPAITGRRLALSE